MLVKKAKQGDKEALVQLIMAEKQTYYKLAYVYMKNAEDAMDAMEDMIVILYESIHRLKSESSFYSWSKTILANCCKNSLKKKSKVVLLDQFQEERQNSFTEEKDEQLRLEKHLSELNSKQQEAIRLRYFMDMDYQNIAELLKIPVGTVKSRISIGLSKLKVVIGGEEL
ncbi:MAG: polymerase subunit sigma-24 [Clostridia bacterium]|jgi:RNA polymerase sigma-70 factor (ECF subfamily)|nr:polymerase subunit sigma-24 [Clostridia bacterium]